MLGASACGAVLTWTGAIRTPVAEPPSPYIRRATSHARLLQTVQIQPLIGQNVARPSPPSAYYSASTPPTAYRQTTFTNGAFSASSASPSSASTSTATTFSSVKAPTSRLQEFALKLDTPQFFTAGGHQIPITLHDFGSETIGVRVNWGSFVRLRKQSNPDPHELSELTLIYQSGSTKAYHLNSPRAPIGCYLIRVVEG